MNLRVRNTTYSPKVYEQEQRIFHLQDLYKQGKGVSDAVYDVEVEKLYNYTQRGNQHIYDVADIRDASVRSTKYHISFKVNGVGVTVEYDNGELLQVTDTLGEIWDKDLCVQAGIPEEVDSDIKSIQGVLTVTTDTYNTMLEDKETGIYENIQSCVAKLMESDAEGVVFIGNDVVKEKRRMSKRETYDLLDEIEIKTPPNANFVSNSEDLADKLLKLMQNMLYENEAYEYPFTAFWLEQDRRLGNTYTVMLTEKTDIQKSKIDSMSMSFDAESGSYISYATLENGTVLRIGSLKNIWLLGVSVGEDLYYRLSSTEYIPCKDSGVLVV